MQVKESANYYAKSLYLEGALLKNDIDSIKKITASGLDINEKYLNINIDDNGLPLTPIEMAVKTNCQKAIEYFYLHSNNQTKKSGIFGIIASKNITAFNFVLEKNPNIVNSIDYYTTSIRHNNNEAFKTFFYKSNINIDNIPNLTPLILENNSDLIYEQLSKTNQPPLPKGTGLVNA